MRRTGTRGARLLAATAALTLALSPVLVPTGAEARPGGGFSSGSRGSRTYSAPPSTNTAPGTTNSFNRTETPRGGYNQQSPAGQAAPGYAGTPARSGFGGGFGAGLMGGLLGAGIAGMLFGSGAFGGISGVAGFLGFLLQIALVVGLVMLALRFFRRRAQNTAGGMAPAMAGNAPRGYAREMMPGAGTGGSAGSVAAAPLQVTQKDFASFERSLLEVNAAWSRGDATALNRLSTPEMGRYFAQDLRDLQARGWRNETRDVKLESGDLSEAWREGDREYATVAMRFGLVDVTRDASGHVVEGDPAARQTAVELWTFTRRPGTEWVVSAIQQSGR